MSASNDRMVPDQPRGPHATCLQSSPSVSLRPIGLGSQSGEGLFQPPVATHSAVRVDCAAVVGSSLPVVGAPLSAVGRGVGPLG